MTPPSIEIPGHGTITGKNIGDKAYRYTGIPYALPPIGANRFCKPRLLPADFRYERLNNEFQPRCHQPTNYVLSYGPRPPADIPETEDCLYLNIWTPTQAEETHRPAQGWPILFHVHGGWFQVGTAYQDAVKDWSHFVAPESKGGAGMRCIVVCPAYRLNVFGFLSVPEQDGHTDGKGNFGFFDQRAALEWTHRFASSLRGNPDNISVSGLSAGAQSAHAQVLYEFDRSQHDDAYRPIIKRILLRSGTAMVPCREASEAREGFLELCEKLDISANTDEARLTALREVPASDIVKAIPKMKLHTFRPVLDGGVAQGGFVSSTAGINMQKGVFSQWCKRNGITFILSEAANEEEIYKLINYPKKAPWKAELIRELHNYYPARVVEALLEAYDLPADDETDPKAWVHSFGEVSTDAQVYSAERLLYKYLVRPDIGGLNQEDVLRARLERRAAVYDDAFPKWMGVFHGCEDTLYGFNRPMIEAATNRAEAVRDLSAFIDFLGPFKGWLAGVSSQQTWDQWLKAPGKALDSGQTTAIVRVLRSNGEIELEEDIRASDKAKAMRALESTIVAPR